MGASYDPITVVYNSVVSVTVSADGFQAVINADAFLTAKQAEYFRTEVDAATSNYIGLPKTYYNLFKVANDVHILISKFKSVGWIIV
ncbi:hypothetical protein [Paenibacillus ottowii]|uniref:Uncharacterized protein n=1 Tax=Paenibacillus ottowii TaxID=2315729 RepID=A0ABY3BB86_9BACL|nr:hypothetical protein [Paenibacillus ottowii]TQS01358.1 hypothetical protein FKV70_03225 [Paenibacillus ottowii]TQS01413.1 hypothetical protein FKV70_03515 [Paenibacillus ottowii]